MVELNYVPLKKTSYPEMFNSYTERELIIHHVRTFPHLPHLFMPLLGIDKWDSPTHQRNYQTINLFLEQSKHLCLSSGLAHDVFT